MLVEKTEIIVHRKILQASHLEAQQNSLLDPEINGPGGVSPRGGTDLASVERVLELFKDSKVVARVSFLRRVSEKTG